MVLMPGVHTKYDIENYKLYSAPIMDFWKLPFM